MKMRTVVNEFIYVSGKKAKMLGSRSRKRSYVWKVRITELEHGYSYKITVQVQPLIQINRNLYGKNGNEYQRIFGTKYSTRANIFDCTVDKLNEQVKFGPTGNLGMIEDIYRGQGIGSYALSKIINRLKEKNFNHYTVKPLHLSLVDATTDEDTLNRNHFYMGLGFYIESVSKKCGHATVETIDDLSAKYNRAKVKDLSFDFINMQLAVLTESNEKLQKQAIFAHDYNRLKFKEKMLLEGKVAFYQLLIICIFSGALIFAIKDIWGIVSLATALFALFKFPSIKFWVRNSKFL